MVQHAQNGAIREHSLERHGSAISSDAILQHVKPLFHSCDKYELQLAEAIFIKYLNPRLNRQREGDTRILKIF